MCLFLLGFVLGGRKSHKTSSLIVQNVYIHKLKIMRFYISRCLMLFYRKYQSLNLKVFLDMEVAVIVLILPRKKVVGWKSPLKSVQQLGLLSPRALCQLSYSLPVLFLRNVLYLSSFRGLCQIQRFTEAWHNCIESFIIV